MVNIKKRLNWLLSDTEDLYDKMKLNFKKRLNLYDPVHICSYRMYGSQECIHLKGRVLENKGITSAADSHSTWRNIINMYKRFESDEVPGAKLSIKFMGNEYPVTADDEGFFYCSFRPECQLLAAQVWHEAEVTLLESPLPFEGKINSPAMFLIPPPDAEFGIISDIDDTVIESFATRKLKMLKTVLLNNARTRMPFEGVSAFYRALQAGGNGKKNNPFFYVSSSPWNLYDFLTDFLDVNGIPVGPLLLRDTGIDREKFFSKGHKAHKYTEIEKILKTYPALKFILIGDSGQQDPAIYGEVASKFPDRILAIYIRDVKLPEKAKVVIEMSEKMKTGPVPMILVENTVKAAEHALEKGYILPETMKDIRITKITDNSAEVDQLEKKHPEEVKEKVKEEIIEGKQEIKEAKEQGEIK
jgi:phosphatidate phosphatase APP1